MSLVKNFLICGDQVWTLGVSVGFSNNWRQKMNSSPIHHDYRCHGRIWWGVCQALFCPQARMRLIINRAAGGTSCQRLAKAELGGATQIVSVLFWIISGPSRQTEQAFYANLDSEEFSAERMFGLIMPVLPRAWAACSLIPEDWGNAWVGN